LEQSRTGDLTLFDRGYPAFWLYALLASKQRAFCMRAKTRLDLNIKAFLQSGQRQALVTFTPNRLAEEACRERGLPVYPIRLRLIRVEMGTQSEVLMTHLLDEQAYPVEDFAALCYPSIRVNAGGLRSNTNGKNSGCRSRISAANQWKRFDRIFMPSRWRTI